MTPLRQHRPRHHSPLLRSLDAEWDRIQRRRDVMDRVRSWPDMIDDSDLAAALRTALDATTDVRELLDSTNRNGLDGSSARPDDVLAALVVAALVDPLAARIVVQRILPGVIATSRRWVDGTPDRTIDHAVGTCWIAIAGYDARRRRHHVAASLISDVVWLAFRQAARRRSSTEVPTDERLLDRRPTQQPGPHPLVVLARTVRAAELAGVDDSHLDLVRDLVRVGSPSELARQRCVTPRTIRNRRDAARDEIRRALGLGPTDRTNERSAA